MKKNDKNKPSSLKSKLENIQAHIDKSVDDQVETIEQVANSKPVATSEKRINRPGRAAPAIREDAQRSMLQAEQSGQYLLLPFAPGSESPSLLTRLPIFSPARRSTQRSMMDEQNGIPFQTSWGSGVKYGPPLTTYDEDTLLALYRLRQYKVIGYPQNLPIAVSQMFIDPKTNKTHSHVLHCLVSEINKMCGTPNGGRSHKDRLESVKYLSATSLVLDSKTAEKYVGTGTTIRFMDVAWQEFDRTGVLYVQFSPIVTYWLENQYTFIDWEIRKQLTNTGKAVHRFLSGQPREYTIFTKKLSETIGYPKAQNKFVQELRRSLDDLVELKWLHSYEIVGTGRATPFKLSISRP